MNICDGSDTEKVYYLIHICVLDVSVCGVSAVMIHDFVYQQIQLFEFVSYHNSCNHHQVKNIYIELRTYRETSHLIMVWHKPIIVQAITI